MFDYAFFENMGKSGLACLIPFVVFGILWLIFEDEDKFKDEPFVTWLGYATVTFAAMALWLGFVGVLGMMWT